MYNAQSKTPLLGVKRVTNLKGDIGVIEKSVEVWQIFCVGDGNISKCYGEMSNQESDVELEFGSKSSKDEEMNEVDDGILVSECVLHGCE